MPDYITMSDLSAVLPGQSLIQALDDDSDGLADPAVFAAVTLAVQRSIDGALGARFSVPFQNPLPAVVQDAALVLVAETLYQRRGVAAEANPWAARANDVRAKLAKIGAGELPLQPERQSAASSGTAITTPVRATSRTSGRLAT